jgi:hypothetical protein
MRDEGISVTPAIVFLTGEHVALKAKLYLLALAASQDAARWMLFRETFSRAAGAFECPAGVEIEIRTKPAIQTAGGE